MKKTSDKPKTSTPRGIQYGALKGMSYRPSRRDEHRKARKGAKLAIRRGDYA